MTKERKIEQALEVIRSTHGVRKTDAVAASENQAWRVINEEMDPMRVDIDAAEPVFNIDPRYTLQSVTVPDGKRGNLAAYAGKDVFVFTTYVHRSGARINFYIGVCAGFWR